MDLNTITVTDFKSLFSRDFPYLPEWDSSKLYNADAIVYYTPTLLFYKAKVNGITPGTLPTDTSKWELYADDTLNYVLDGDITKAFAEAKINLNQTLFSSDDNIKIGYLYLTAHYLVNDIRTAMSGLGSAGVFITSSKTVGSVSETFAIPEAYTKSPILSFYTTTGYGVKYLNLIYAKTRGNMVAVGGMTRP